VCIPPVALRTFLPAYRLQTRAWQCGLFRTIDNTATFDTVLAMRIFVLALDTTFDSTGFFGLGISGKKLVRVKQGILGRCKP
jgi:hypothetical protein